MKRWQQQLSSGARFFVVLIWFWITASASGAGWVAGWGNNEIGQTTVPVGLGPVKSVAAGAGFSSALKSDGTVVVWGGVVSAPTNVPAGLNGVKAISAGSLHMLALRGDGTVEAWGNAGSNVTTVPVGLSDVVAVAACADHNLALKADGTVIAWGANGGGQSTVPAALSNVVAIAGGTLHNLALGADGRVTAWGDNSYGQTNVPPDLSNVVAIAAGNYHSLALKSDGTVSAWGDPTNDKTHVPAGLSNVMAIAAGPDRSLALKKDGTLVIWGNNTSGQGSVPAGLLATEIAAGLNHNLALVSEGPVQILQNPQSQLVNYSSNAVLSVSVSGSQPMSFQWRFNGSNLVNNAHVNGSTNATLTINNLLFTDTGSYSVLVSNAFGSVRSLEATLAVFSPPLVLQQSPSQILKAGSDVTLSASVVGSPTLVYQWLVGGTNIVGATRSGLTLTNVQPSMSGDYVLTISNSYGVAQTAPISLVIADSIPYILQQPSNRVAGLGGSASFSVNARGSLPLSYQWRFNGEDIQGATNAALTLGPLSYGQSGYYNVVVGNPFGEVISAKAFLNVVQTAVWSDSNVQQPYAPTNVPPGLTNLIAVAAGNYHVLGLKSDSTVATWMNTSGPPTQLGGVTNLPAGLTNVVALAAAANVSMVLKADGRVVAWGVSSSGQTNVPTSLTNAIGIAAGSTHCLAVRSNGTVVTWGGNTYGQTNVPAGLSNVVSVAAGAYSSMALRSDGSVVVWGGNAGESRLPAGLSNNAVAIAAGQGTCFALLNNGTIIEWGLPPTLPPLGLSNVVSIAASGGLAIALKSDGTAVTWGLKGVVQPPAPTNLFAIGVGGSETRFYMGLVGDGRPIMKVQPFSRSIVKGSSVPLAGFAVGMQPMSYQWLHDGDIIPGANKALLTLTNVQGKDTGGYQLLVSNALGQTNSTTAFLSMPNPSSLAEAVNSTSTFSTSGPTNALWFPQVRVSHDGEGAAQSGPVTDNQQTTMQTTVTGPGTLRFWWKVSSEEGFDFLRFAIDTPAQWSASISGEVDWQEKAFAIPAGQHTVYWIYFKDSSVSDGDDAGWVDQVVFTPTPVVITQQPVSQSVPEGGTATFSVQATGGVLTYQWLKDGTNLLGATSTNLSLTNVAGTNAGVYAVRVSNGATSVLSSNAVLTVTGAQVLGSPSIMQDGSMILSSRMSTGGAMTPEQASGLELQVSDDLITWVALTNSPVVTNGAIQFVEPNCTNYVKRFYRVVGSR
jgi:alpha-tubulin suppressor-like RCC1 family protein